MIAIKPCTFDITSYDGVAPVGYVGPYEGPLPGPENRDQYIALCDPPYVREKTAVEKKVAAAVVKREEIYREQEIRSATLLEFQMPRQGFALIEEFYLQLIVAAARKPISEIDSPLIWGLSRLRANRNTLLAALELWVNDPTKTTADILGFDVTTWAGWEVLRP